MRWAPSPATTSSAPRPGASSSPAPSGAVRSRWRRRWPPIRKMKEIDAVGIMQRMGQRLRDGIDAQAKAHGVTLQQSGPAQMPVILFDDDADRKKGWLFCTEALKRGIYLHATHTMFLSAAHTRRRHRSHAGRDRRGDGRGRAAVRIGPMHTVLAPVDNDLPLAGREPGAGRRQEPHRPRLSPDARPPDARHLQAASAAAHQRAVAGLRHQRDAGARGDLPADPRRRGGSEDAFLLPRPQAVGGGISRSGARSGCCCSRWRRGARWSTSPRATSTCSSACTPSWSRPRRRRITRPRSGPISISISGSTACRRCRR